jgi:hypothetical protein
VSVDTYSRMSAAKLVSHIGLLVLVAGAPLAIGCVHPPAMLAAGAVAAIAFAALLRRRRETEREVRVPALGWILLGVTVFTALQCVPLPAAILKVIAPANHRLFVDTLGDLGLYGPGSWRPLSLDPPATLWETLKIATLAATFLLAANLEEHRHRRQTLLLVIGGAGLVMMAVGVAQTSAGTDKIFGVFQPWSVGRPRGVVFTTFVNANHSAAFLSVSAAAWVGLAAATSDLAKRVLCVIAAVVAGAGVFLAVSRGGIAGFVVAQVAVVGLLLFRRRRAATDGAPPRRGRLRPLLRLWVPLVLAGAIGVGLWLAYEPLVGRLGGQMLSQEVRPEVWKQAMPMLRDHRWLGIGRGAFGTSYARYKESPRFYTYSHLENEYLQLPIDLGVPVGAGLLLCLGIAAAGWLRRGDRGPAQAAALAGLAGLAAHAAGDFNLEILGVALPAAALAGMLAATTPPGALTRDRIPRRASRGTLMLLPLALVALFALGLTPLATWSERDAARLSARRREPLASFLARAQAVVRRHPADYLPYAIVGDRLAEARDERALRWLNRAMILNPTHPGPHLVAARALRASGHAAQALVEYRAGLARQPRQGPAILVELVQSYPDAAALLQAMPDRPDYHSALVAALAAAQRPQQAEEVARLAHGRWPRDPAALTHLVALAQARRDLGAAETWARALLAADGGPRSWAALGGILCATERQAECLSHYQAARERHPGDLGILVGLSSAYVGLKRFPEARRTADAIGSLPSVSPAVLARMHDQLAVIDEADGRPHRAEWERGEARRLRSGP